MSMAQDYMGEKICSYCGRFEHACSNECIEKIIKEKGFDREKLRLNIGAGNIRYSNCINIDLEKKGKIPGDEMVIDTDMQGDIRKGLPFLKSDTFVEILLIHVIEHIERKYQARVFSEIWRLLKPNGRLILGYPDFIETAKLFIENKYGGRWRLYNACMFGRQAYPGDYHVTAIERQDITDRLISAGFVNIKHLQTGINATMLAYKGEQLNYL